jgi:hypothetical protein
MRSRLFPALLVLLASAGASATPETLPRSDKTLVELIHATMASLPTPLVILDGSVPGGLSSSADAPPMILRSAPFLTRDGYHIVAFEARSNPQDGSDSPTVRFTSLQMADKPCFARADAAVMFRGVQSTTVLPMAPPSLPNSYLVTKTPWGRLSFGTSAESGPCVVTIVGDATPPLPPGLALPAALPQQMPDLRQTWPMTPPEDGRYRLN